MKEYAVKRSRRCVGNSRRRTEYGKPSGRRMRRNGKMSERQKIGNYGNAS
jgi:hypothetical protein